MTSKPELAAVLNRQFLMISGKGGTGKTTLAMSLGKLAASLGKRTLLVESSVIPQFSRRFQVPYQIQQCCEISDLLACINIEGRECFREYVCSYLGKQQLYDRVISRKPIQDFLAVIPGLDEVMLLGKMFQLCRLVDRYDHVLFDAPASGHFLNLVTTPDAILSTQLSGPLVHEIQRVKEFITDPSLVGFLLVTQPEELILSETIEFYHALQQTALSCAGIVLNRWIPSADREEVSSKLALFESNYFVEKFKGIATCELQLEKFMEDQECEMYRAFELGCIPEQVPSNLHVLHLGGMS